MVHGSKEFLLHSCGCLCFFLTSCSANGWSVGSHARRSWLLPMAADSATPVGVAVVVVVGTMMVVPVDGKPRHPLDQQGDYGYDGYLLLTLDPTRLGFAPH